jgi:hypothetical protein
MVMNDIFKGIYGDLWEFHGDLWGYSLLFENIWPKIFKIPKFSQEIYISKFDQWEFTGAYSWYNGITWYNQEILESRSTSH